MIYIAGPMTGYPNHNRDRFNVIAESLRAKGHGVHNPAEIDLGPDAPWEDYMRMALSALAGCDTIVMLDGWRHSRGACLERQIAEQLNMEIIE